MDVKQVTLVFALAGCAGRAPVPIAAAGVVCRGAALCVPAERADALLQRSSLRVLDVQPVGRGLARPMILTARLGERGPTVRLKWKAAAHGGEGHNRSPRHELAAYALQQLIFDRDEYVVPPTAGRCLTRADYALFPRAMPKPTFAGADCVFGVLSYWLDHVDDLHGVDRGRFARDHAYRRAIANLNVLTYLIDHRDSKDANFLLTTPPLPARAFAVDNGIAFSGFRTFHGYFGTNWSHLLVPAVPAKVIGRLRHVDAEELRKLAVVAEFVVRDGTLVPVAPSAPFDDDVGVRRRGDVVQLGLTRTEIAEVASRIRRLVAAVDDGELAVFDDRSHRTASR